MKKTPLLLKLSHTNNDEWEHTYNILFNNPFSVHINIPIKQYRATESYPAFFYYTPDIIELLEKIRKKTLVLNEVMGTLPPIALKHFTTTCMIEEILFTNEIEGIRSSRSEIRTVLNTILSKANPNTIRLGSVVGKYILLNKKENFSFDNATELRSFYDDFVAEEVITEDPGNALDGKILRADMVDVKSPGGKVIHQGAYPEKNLISYMDQAFSLLHSDSIPDLIRVSVFHYLFGYLHPFYDGNGRTSRFITSFFLSKMLNRLVAFRLSITIKKSLRTYYKLFANTNDIRNRGDLTPFITGFLWLIEQSILRTIELLREKQTELTNLNEILDHHHDFEDKLDNQIAYVLLQAALFSDAGASVKEISRTIGKSEVTVKRRLKKLDPYTITNTDQRAYLYRLDLNKLKGISPTQ